MLPKSSYSSSATLYFSDSAIANRVSGTNSSFENPFQELSTMGLKIKSKRPR